RTFDGLIEEVRISNIPRSAGWIGAQYKSMTDTFATYGAEESYPPHDFFNEAEGAYAIDMADDQKLVFDIHGTPSNPRYSPAFKIRNYRSLDAPQTVYRDETLLEEGTDYVVGVIPFSEAWYSQPFWYPGYAYRRQLTIGSTSSGYSIKLALSGSDASDIYNNCNDKTNGDDFRVVWWDGSQWNDLDRELESFTSSNITVWFRIQEPGGWAGGPSNYYLYYGNSSPAAVKANKSMIYDLWDDFETMDNWTPFTEEGYVTSSAFIDGGSVSLTAGSYTTLATLPTSFAAGNNFVIAIVQVNSTTPLSIASTNLQLQRTGSITLMSNLYSIDVDSTAPNNQKWYALMAYDSGAAANQSYRVRALVSGTGMSAEAKILAINGVTGAQAPGTATEVPDSETTLTTLNTSFPAGDNIVLGIFEAENTQSNGALVLTNVRLKRGTTELAKNQWNIYIDKSGTLQRHQVHLLVALDTGAPASPTYTATGVSNSKQGNITCRAKIVAFRKGTWSAAYSDGVARASASPK
ncbi:MAG: hypothetical protein GTO14_17990, partial [Anaerolineales bacterium]|nr:hypothetical protein [Anaerolineae bacterium]NIS82047.1 hypothetical protein [Anaerolineales bacterium]